MPKKRKSMTREEWEISDLFTSGLGLSEEEMREQLKAHPEVLVGRARAARFIAGAPDTPAEAPATPAEDLASELAAVAREIDALAKEARKVKGQGAIGRALDAIVRATDGLASIANLEHDAISRLMSPDHGLAGVWGALGNLSARLDRLERAAGICAGCGHSANAHRADCPRRAS